MSRPAHSGIPSYQCIFQSTASELRARSKNIARDCFTFAWRRQTPFFREATTGDLTTLGGERAVGHCSQWLGLRARTVPLFLQTIGLVLCPLQFPSISHFSLFHPDRSFVQLNGEHLSAAVHWNRFHIEHLSTFYLEKSVTHAASTAEA